MKKVLKRKMTEKKKKRKKNYYFSGGLGSCWPMSASKFHSHWIDVVGHKKRDNYPKKERLRFQIEGKTKLTQLI